MYCFNMIVQGALSEKPNAPESDQEATVVEMSKSVSKSVENDRLESSSGRGKKP